MAAPTAQQCRFLKAGEWSKTERLFCPTEPQKAQTESVPSIAAAIIASILGWIIDAAIEPFMGIGGRVFVGLIVSTVAFVYARNWLVRLRDG